MQIDINCDMGESYGHFVVGNDEALMPFISSVNVACGFHAGDPGIIHQTIRLAEKYNVAIGAHPSYPDLAGFGRREIPLDAQEVYDCVLYQVGAVAAFTKAAGSALHHVKPHGALYNKAAVDSEIADAIVNAIFYFDPRLILYGLPLSELAKAAARTGLTYCNEAFSDRTYTSIGQLTPRHDLNALITTASKATEQVLQIINHKKVNATDGSVVEMDAQTICIHGDSEYALPIATALHASLTENGIKISPPPFVDER